jgi:hypothetical protein
MTFKLFCALVLGGFTVVEARGIDLFPTAEHVVVPASVRSSPGGYRSFHFWHTGYFGGK